MNDTEFRLPDLGEGIHEAEILRWHVNVGNCYLYWRQNGGVDCSNCVAACPWSQQSRPWL